MNRTLILLGLGVALGGCSARDDAHDDHAHVHAGGHHGHAEADDYERGVHGGRLLRGDGFAVELAIHEQGVPPEFRAWLYRGDEPVAPTAGRVAVRLTRLGGLEETHVLEPRGDHLAGSGVVGEPHSFAVEVRASVGGASERWAYDTFEGRTTIDADVAEASGIRIAPATACVIRDEHEVQGLLTPIEGRRAHLAARFPGPIREVRVGVGDAVRAGEVLATVESNASLSRYTITSPLDGTVLARDAAVGEIAGNAPLFEVADLSSLWVDLHVFGDDALHITAGLPVVVSRVSDGISASTTLDRVLPVTATASQSTVARATVANDDGRWRPGAAVRARVTVAEDAVAMCVPLAALQRFRGGDAVYIRIGDIYEVRPVTLGRRDGARVEVLDGITTDHLVVVEQSFLVRADVEKSGAAHDH